MGKLQRIEKPNDRFIFMMYPPVDDMSALGWDKGDELEFDVQDGALIVRRV